LVSDKPIKALSKRKIGGYSENGVATFLLGVGETVRNPVFPKKADPAAKSVLVLPPKQQGEPLPEVIPAEGKKRYSLRASLCLTAGYRQR
jgi:hypothetical protein